MGLLALPSFLCVSSLSLAAGALRFLSIRLTIFCHFRILSYTVDDCRALLIVQLPDGLPSTSVTTPAEA